ncbi:TetR/AcrR family transcriptional regulator [Ferrimonas marina]|uniref:Transcriptional regulator, TetR family n=1 Tax=Ferrimonas marina TaxID=299255 RepID=A0A1M5RUP4_9GAMM|nr:TetR/AcrR family transcriptional regulator [Ferrimonas marina]SHH29956.1 transcriptional regulator, TetR family [Ferrimonas marina]
MTESPVPSTKVAIAARLEQAFSEQGFAEPGVAQLKTISQVSLRTLYKHYPSKEAMVIGALEHRHQRYSTLLQGTESMTPSEAVNALFDRLADWMRDEAPHGCLSVNALAAFPDSAAIRDAVNGHKQAVRQQLGRLSGRPDLATALFLLHEGASSSWPLLADAAIDAARQSALTLILETQA